MVYTTRHEKDTVYIVHTHTHTHTHNYGYFYKPAVTIIPSNPKPACSNAPGEAVKKQPVFGRFMSMDIWLTGIIGCTSAVRIVTGSGWGLRSILQTLCTLSSKFGVSSLLNSGAIASSPKISKIGQLYVLLDSVPCLYTFLVGILLQKIRTFLSDHGYRVTLLHIQQHPQCTRRL